MIDQISNRGRLFALTVSSFVDRHAKAIADLPGIFLLGKLLNGSNDCGAPYPPFLLALCLIKQTPSNAAWSFDSLAEDILPDSALAFHRPPSDA